MKIFYVVDPSGTIKSSDGTKTYKVLTGKALKDFLSSEEGKKRRFDIRKDERGNQIGVELPPSMYKKHDEECNREKYLYKVRAELDISETSIEGMLFDDGEGNGEEILADEKQDLEAFLIDSEEKSILRKALKSLTLEEKKIIVPLFFEEGMTERKLADRLGLKKTYLHTQKIRILEKIKSFF